MDLTYNRKLWHKHLVQVDNDMKIVVVTQTGQDFAEGSEIRLEFALNDLYIFDCESDQTL